ncbi:hypothetical protein AB0H00_02890 [Nocardia sp. NPDC023852]|uniref:hypothetical protein n=1 Tax=Nocardia sp. NPDC023852 TaxID=3154697 RepID=UPI0033C4D876
MAQAVGLTGVLVRTRKFRAEVLDASAHAPSMSSTRWPRCPPSLPTGRIDRNRRTGLCAKKFYISPLKSAAVV